MFHYKRDIFDFFPNKSILQRFCDKINQCDADVYLVMAHKAVQLFQVLLDQGHIQKHIGRKKSYPVKRWIMTVITYSIRK